MLTYASAVASKKESQSSTEKHGLSSSVAIPASTDTSSSSTRASSPAPSSGTQITEAIAAATAQFKEEGSPAENHFYAKRCEVLEAKVLEQEEQLKALKTQMELDSVELEKVTAQLDQSLKLQEGMYTQKQEYERQGIEKTEQINALQAAQALMEKEVSALKEQLETERETHAVTAQNLREEIKNRKKSLDRSLTSKESEMLELEKTIQTLETEKDILSQTIESMKKMEAQKDYLHAAELKKETESANTLQGTLEKTLIEYNQLKEDQGKSQIEKEAKAAEYKILLEAFETQKESLRSQESKTVDLSESLQLLQKAYLSLEEKLKISQKDKESMERAWEVREGKYQEMLKNEVKHEGALSGELENVRTENDKLREAKENLQAQLQAENAQWRAKYEALSQTLEHERREFQNHALASSSSARGLSGEPQPLLQQYNQAIAKLNRYEAIGPLPENIGAITKATIRYALQLNR